MASADGSTEASGYRAATLREPQLTCHDPSLRTTQDDDGGGSQQLSPYVSGLSTASAVRSAAGVQLAQRHLQRTQIAQEIEHPWLQNQSLPPS
jgi:hypothetical protein